MLRTFSTRVRTSPKLACATSSSPTRRGAPLLQRRRGRIRVGARRAWQRRARQDRPPWLRCVPSSRETMADADKPLQGTTLVVGTIALSLATFMNVLDTSIANVSLPSIAGDLGV